MRFAFVFILFLLLIFAFGDNLAAQTKDRVEAREKLSAETAGVVCQDLKPGRIVAFPKPIYPNEAKFGRVGGTIRATVKIDASGNAVEIERIEGAEILRAAATGAARKTKYKPTLCDGAATAVTAVFTYDFILFVSTDSYFAPAKIEEFPDLKTDSPYYEAVLNLADNYKLAFGYADKKFYADAPLTRGDFAQFLRLTLDLLSRRAADAKKIPREINLFYAHNPRKILTANSIKDLKTKDPFYDSVKTLLLKYDIALTNDKSEFQGKLYLTNNEVIDWWSRIFGADAIPINFARTTDGDPIFSRGEFALFLQESLQVLTYKVLP